MCLSVLVRLPLLSPLELVHDAVALLAQRDPEPEIANHFYKQKRKDDAVLEAVGRRGAAAAAKEAGLAAGAGGVDAEGAGGAEKVAVEDEGHGEEEADGGWMVSLLRSWVVLGGLGWSWVGNWFRVGVFVMALLGWSFGMEFLGARVVE